MEWSLFLLINNPAPTDPTHQDGHSQGTLLYYLERHAAKQRLQNAHAATADIRIYVTTLEHLCETLHISEIESLWERSEDARIPTHMPFGKHKGVPIAEVPKDYARWLLDQPNVDPAITKAFLKYGK